MTPYKHLSPEEIEKIKQQDRAQVAAWFNKNVYPYNVPYLLETAINSPRKAPRPPAAEEKPSASPQDTPACRKRARSPKTPEAPNGFVNGLKRSRNSETEATKSPYNI